MNTALQKSDENLDVSGVLGVAPLSMSASYQGYAEISDLWQQPITQTSAGSLFLESTKSWENLIDNNKIAVCTQNNDYVVFFIKDSSSITSKLLDETLRLDKVSAYKALDYLYDKVDLMLFNKEFDKISDFLNRVKPERFSVETLLGFLTITLIVKDKIKSRSDLYQNIKSYLSKVQNEEYAVKVLQGLD